ncbi:MAG: hypothetical protein IJ439_03610 [Tyzzerella sp.]|nr:hypothetical protein [Tyzzerella sp.]
MKYLNTKTQAVIETACVVKGGDWVKVQTKQPKKSTKNPVKTTSKESGE